MPNDNAIVGSITRIEPSLEQTSAEDALRERPDGVEISFGDAPIVRIVPGDIAVGTLEILEQLRRIGQPAYVEIEPDTRVVVRMLIPLVTQVENTRDEGDAVSVRGSLLMWRACAGIEGLGMTTREPDRILEE
jgi:hypothetical protein